MVNRRTQAEVEAVFSTLGLPIIERSIEEIRRSRQSFASERGVVEAPGYFHRTVISNGTNTASTWIDNDAKLEPSSR